ncbi:MAG: hypothetical protein ACJ0P1_03375 [Flavobacteriaceae bacterium]
MKNILIVFSILFSSLTFSQNLYWYDVMLEVEGKDAPIVAGLIDDFYSNHPKPSNVKVAFSSIPLKGASEKATHMLGFTSESSKSLADFRNSLQGTDWDLYISKMRKYVESSRASAGRDLITNGSDTSYPIGQAWVFKTTNPKLPSMIEAFGKLIKSNNFDGFIGMGQIIHGADKGENVYIYGTYSDLNDAFNFGPQSKKEIEAFTEFTKVFDDAAQYSKTFTRVLIKSY